ncbi:class I SAM-dependent rRNA methyltransferase [Deinococcus arenicola]|uniref:Class I SAM-dependent methyltransferase n=1 Tax=Deinococcus arenicola TaxID=2994950 RepID=A0ABU4DVD6_9DEIO|nr:class I SAM-dependent methyltransferase [Deinococcus sp. ZS9-10]MDV6375892.1 class I SAM-dependent methyltransferase [Deinococcus sp. ZS9-10]
MTQNLTHLLTRRAHLPAQGTTFYRGVHTTETDGLFALDVAGDAGILSLYADLSPQEEAELAQECAVAAHLGSVYLKRRPPEARHAANVDREWLSPPEPIWGEAQAEVTALENGVPFLIRPGADLSIGLFADARPVRQWVRQHAPTRVLNAFAYTCGFGVNAALGGSQVVKNVDLSRKVLNWGQGNYALSGLNAPDEDFLYGDVFDWFRRLANRGDTFDLVVLDPPSFARGKGGAWRAERDYARLATLAAEVTAPGGQMLTLLNHAGVSSAYLDRMVRLGLEDAERQGRAAHRLDAGEDFPEASHLKAVVWTLDT